MHNEFVTSEGPVKRVLEDKAPELKKQGYTLHSWNFTPTGDILAVFEKTGMSDEEFREAMCESSQFFRVNKED